MHGLLISLALFTTADDTKQPTIDTPAGIVWFGTWEQARLEAARTQRPILLLSAAPACHGVPGIW